MIKKNDIIFLIGVILLFLPFFISKEIYDYYFQFNKEHGLITAFVKFAILATIGDVIGLRIKTGSYFKNGYGILPRMIVWGILGVTIKIAFIVFASGTPVFLESIGLENAQLVMKGAFTPEKLLVAFCISVALNLIYAPVMMTLHTITDMHIVSNRGTLKGFFTPIKFRKLFVSLNWDVQWNFVLQKNHPIILDSCSYYYILVTIRLKNIICSITRYSIRNHTCNCRSDGKKCRGVESGSWKLEVGKC